jgi:hypothetical protein
MIHKRTHLKGTAMQTPPTLLTKERAEQLAQQNTASDGEWTYKAEPTQQGNSSLYLVVIYDLDGHKIGTL